MIIDLAKGCGGSEIMLREMQFIGEMERNYAALTSQCPDDYNYSEAVLRCDGCSEVGECMIVGVEPMLHFSDNFLQQLIEKSQKDR